MILLQIFHIWIFFTVRWVGMSTTWDERSTIWVGWIKDGQLYCTIFFLWCLLILLVVWDYMGIWVAIKSIEIDNFIANQLLYYCQIGKNLNNELNFAVRLVHMKWMIIFFLWFILILLVVWDYMAHTFKCC